MKIRFPLIIWLLGVLLFIPNQVTAQNSPAADRTVVSDSFRKEKTQDHSLKKSAQPEQFQKNIFKSFRKLKKKRGMDPAAEFFLGLLGAFIMLGSVIAGIILFGLIGWWAVLAALLGIFIGFIICAIPSWVGGSSKLAGLAAAVLGAIGLVVSGGIWLIWVIVLGIIELVNL